MPAQARTKVQRRPAGTGWPTGYRGRHERAASARWQGPSARHPARCQESRLLRLGREGQSQRRPDRRPRTSAGAGNVAGRAGNACSGAGPGIPVPRRAGNAAQRPDQERPRLGQEFRLPAGQERLQRLGRRDARAAGPGVGTAGRGRQLAAAGPGMSTPAGRERPQRPARPGIRRAAGPGQRRGDVGGGPVAGRNACSGWTRGRCVDGPENTAGDRPGMPPVTAGPGGTGPQRPAQPPAPESAATSETTATETTALGSRLPRKHPLRSTQPRNPLPRNLPLRRHLRRSPRHGLLPRAGPRRW